MVQFFIIQHEKYYGREITNGSLFFAPKIDSEKYAVSEIHRGDIVFLCSQKGISAVGCVSECPYTTPFPAWRATEAGTGERGYTVPVEFVLLSCPIPFSAESKGDLIRLEGESAISLQKEILQQNPALEQSEWAQEILLQNKF